MYAKSIQSELLQFSAKQPLWVQDSLRRIAIHGKSSQSDLDEAVAMCKSAHGLATSGTVPKPVPLSATHLPASVTSGGCAVNLTELCDLENVNALLSGQTLSFAPAGLTIVYGTNGAGKSGYARVLKRLCRARGSVVPILPNVFGKAPGRPSASITFDVGGAPSVWTGAIDESGPAPPAVLAEVAVFDVAAATHTVEKQQEVALLPPGLDLLPVLKDVLDHVVATLKKEDESDSAPSMPNLNPGTPSCAFLARLTNRTTEAELDAACSWTADDETARVRAAAAVANLRANNPRALAQRARKRSERIDTLVAALERAGENLDDQVVMRIDQRLRELKDARAAVALHKGDLLPSDLLPGTGGDAWKAMWEAARVYSEEGAFPGHAFPHTEKDARCVLCQQELGDAAVERLQTFVEFVADALSKNLKAAEAAVAKAVQHVAQAIEPGLEAGNLMDVLDDLEEIDSQAVKGFVEASMARRDALRTCLDPDMEDGDVPALAGAPTDELKATAAAAKEQAARLNAQTEEDAIKQAISTMNELEDRKVLSGVRGRLEAEVERKARVERRKVARRDCRTNQVTTLLDALTATHVTEALASAFNKELLALGGKHLAVEVIKTGTSKATTYTALALKNAAHDKAVVRSVLSEGEQRAVSLAWFFAELTLSTSKSAIVFDDPVSSLDHDWRRSVAARLSEEAAQRQVVVFTHDAVFLHMLHADASAAGAVPYSLQVQRCGGAPGYCSADVPWEKKNVKQRVGALKDEHVALSKTKKTGTDNEYAENVVGYLDRLRKTWERAVEECLFNGVIERFGYGVKTQSIAEVDVLDTDYAAIDAGMSACSAWVHDPAQGLLAPPPTPDEVASMVNALVDWVTEIRNRRPKNSLPKLTRL
ncbi:MAG: AAA family ATPase [Deltaproteobacteria bacterium]|nr:AAA family ATPase [Deltaproteobacteria bacterium]